MAPSATRLTAPALPPLSADDYRASMSTRNLSTVGVIALLLLGLGALWWISERKETKPLAQEPSTSESRMTDPVSGPTRMQELTERKPLSLHLFLRDAHVLMMELCWHKTHEELEAIYGDPAVMRVEQDEDSNIYYPRLLMRRPIDLGLRDVDAILSAELTAGEIEGMDGIRVSSVVTAVLIKTRRPLAEVLAELVEQGRTQSTLHQLLAHPFVLRAAAEHPVLRSVVVTFSVEQPKFDYNIHREVALSAELISDQDPASGVRASVRGTSGLHAVLDREGNQLDPEFAARDEILDVRGDNGPWPLKMPLEESYVSSMFRLLESSPPSGGKAEPKDD